jgi:hypothetical protein
VAFERIHSLLVVLRARARQCGHRVVLVILRSVCVWIRADSLRVQIRLRVLSLLQALASLADCGRGIGEDIRGLLIAEALLVILVFFLHLLMFLNEHAVIALLALAKRARFTQR